MLTREFDEIYENIRFMDIHEVTQNHRKLYNTFVYHFDTPGQCAAKAVSILVHMYPDYNK